MGCGRSKERSAPPFNPEQDLTGFSFTPSQPSTLSQQEINAPTQGQGRAATTPSQPLTNSYVLQLASRPAHEQQSTNTPIRQQRLGARDTQISVGAPSEEQRWGDHPARLRQRANDADFLHRLSLQSERSSLPGIRTPISSERSSASSLRGASPIGERIPLSIRGRPAINEGPEQPSARLSHPPSWLTSAPEGRGSPFASPLVQESHLSSSFSPSSSSSQQRRKAAGSSQSRPGGASPPPPPPSSPHLNRCESKPLRTQCKKGCRCMTCRPQFYTSHGELTRVWSSPCIKEGCRCPICTEICLSNGHMLPKCEQCRRRGCACSTGCMDINCPICRTAMVMDRGSRPLSRLSSRPSMPRINSGSSLARTSGSDD